MGNRAERRGSLAERGEHPFLGMMSFKMLMGPSAEGSRRNWIRAEEVCTFGIYQPTGSTSVAMVTAMDVFIGQVCYIKETFKLFSHRGSQGASRGVPGKSGLCARGEGERVMALQSWERTRASRRVEEGHSRSFWGCGGKASFPSTSARDLRELPMVPLIGEGCCGVGGASRDSAGLGAMEEGLISRGDRKHRLPLLFGLQPQGPCRVGTGESLQTHGSKYLTFKLIHRNIYIMSTRFQ